MSRERWEVKARLRGSRLMLNRTAQAQCLAISNAFYTGGFPRELRDVMYTHLVDSPKDQRSIRIGYLSPPEYMTSDYYGQSKDMQPSHHSMNPAYVGEDMAREIAEVYYTRNHFYVTNEIYMSKLLLTDYHGLGIRPYEHIRSITLYIKLDTSEPSDSERARLAAIYTHLVNLLLVPRKDLFNLSITLTTWFHREYRDDAYALDDERRFLNLLETLRAPVYELLHAGSNVTLLHYNKDSANGNEQNTGHRTLTPCGHSCDQITAPETNFFALDGETWGQEKAEHSTPYDPPRHFVFRDTQAPTPESAGTEDEFGDRVDRVAGRVRQKLEKRWGKERALEGFVYYADAADDGEQWYGGDTPGGSHEDGEME